MEPLIVLESDNQKDDKGYLALDEDLLYFQQDGAPPYYEAAVRH